MPTVSDPQQRLMLAIDHGWHPTGMKNPPSQAVAHDFVEADKKAGRLKSPKHSRLVKAMMK